MNVLITGGAGYIGSHAVKMMLEQGHHVVVVDDLSTGSASAVDARASFYEVSTMAQSRITDILTKENIEAVMHFAAFSLVGESVENPLKYYHNNIEGTRALLNAMLDANVMTMIFSSTAAVYGEQKTMPIKETVTPDPKNPYGITKRTIEHLLHDVHTANPSFNYMVLRYFNVAGAYHDGTIGENHNPETHLIPNVIKSALFKTPKLKVFGTDYDTPDGSAIRDYIHVEDLIDAHIKALHEAIEQKRSDIYNLGSAKGYSVLDIIRTTEQVLNLKVDYDVADRRAGDPPNLIASHEKIHRDLNWQPTHSLETMIASAATYFKQGGTS